MIFPKLAELDLQVSCTNKSLEWVNEEDPRTDWGGGGKTFFSPSNVLCFIDSNSRTCGVGGFEMSGAEFKPWHDLSHHGSVTALMMATNPNLAKIIPFTSTLGELPARLPKYFLQGHELSSQGMMDLIVGFRDNEFGYQFSTSELLAQNEWMMKFQSFVHGFKKSAALDKLDMDINQSISDARTKGVGIVWSRHIRTSLHQRDAAEGLFRSTRELIQFCPRLISRVPNSLYHLGRFDELRIHSGKELKAA